MALSFQSFGLEIFLGPLFHSTVETCAVLVLYCWWMRGDSVPAGSGVSDVRGILFRQGLGHLVELTEAQPEKTFLAGLDCSEKRSDGRFAIMWEDDLMQVCSDRRTMLPVSLPAAVRQRLYRCDGCRHN